MSNEQAPAADQDAPAIPRGYWEAADGSLVPTSRVSDLDKARDAVVRKLVAQAEKVSEDIAQFKSAALAEITTFVGRSAAQYNVQVRGAAGKGNVTLTSFDGRLKVERKIADRVSFDERLQVAKQAIDDFLAREVKGSNANIRAIVNQYFKVDRLGRVSVSEILKLRQIDIDHPEWHKAMAAVTDSMHIVASVTYLRLYRRDDATGRYEPISLDAAAV